MYFGPLPALLLSNRNLCLYWFRREWHSWHHVCVHGCCFLCHVTWSWWGMHSWFSTLCSPALAFPLKSCQPVESVLVQSTEITWTHHFLGFWMGLLNHKPPAERAGPRWSVFTAVQPIETRTIWSPSNTAEKKRNTKGEKNNISAKRAGDSLNCHSSIFRFEKLSEQHDDHHEALNLSTESLDKDNSTLGCTNLFTFTYNALCVKCKQIVM